MKKELGAAQKKVSEVKRAGGSAEEAIAAMAVTKAAIPVREAEVDALKATLDRELAKIPNEVDAAVPVSNNEEDNAVVRTWGECTTREGLHHHHELLTMIDGYEPERGVGVAGHRGYFLKGAGLLLNQALINFGLTFLSSREYTPLQPPFFMNKDAMSGVAQLEDFDEQLYKVTAGEEDEKYLIATSEQPICAFHRGEWLLEKELPKRYAGFSTCFRKEAGSHGRDAWGIFRVHQFEKVEQFVVCEPEASPAMHKEMVAAAEDFYKALGIPYRVVCIVSGELNNAAAIKYDLEGWFPTLARYRELVSASNCTDYQARAMDVRCGGKKMNEREKKYVHFLNSTLCATTRTICAILDNHQVRAGGERGERG
jgi:seryl-tRNA synthetase